MRFANLQGRAVLVVRADDGTDRAVDIERASDGRLGSDPSVYVDLANHDVLAGIADSVSANEAPVLDLELLGAPVPRPPKGLGVGLNYRTHAIESGREFPTEPHFFGKTNNCVAGPFDDVIAPAGRHEIDYEAEVVIAFGRTCKNATEADAWSYIAGVTCGQDISDRGEQFRLPIKQFTIAKSYDTRARAHRHGERRGDAARQHERPDLLDPGPRRLAQPVHDLRTRRPRVDRHAGWCRRGAHPTAIPDRR